MDTCEVLRNLRAVQKKHENDKLFTFQTDIAGMARDCADCIEFLQAQLAEAKDEVGAAHNREDEAYAALDKANRRADAAVADIEDLMSIIGIDSYETCGYCQREEDEKCIDKNNPSKCLAKWRGAEKGTED